MVIIPAIILIFVHVYITKEVKKLNAVKNNKLEILREKENKLEEKKVEYQKLTSEDEIVKKAKEKFGLIRMNHISEIYVNSNEIKNLKKLVKKKYD